MFTRLVLDDPSLDGIAAVLFDEFHERSLDADLGLALARDAQQGLRPDLKLLVMSATLDGARVAALLGNAPVIESEGRAYPVETRYLGRDPRAPIERQVADAIERALRAETGSVLVFLPGAGEIRRTEMLLKDRMRETNVDVVALYGALDAREQDRAISPSPPGRRKIVLATSIAETSLTIEGVRIVIDSGLSRVPRYEPDVGLTRLETVRVSRAAADQRRGRAGRTEPGVCYRLWDEPQTSSLEPYTRPEILSADLSSFVLDLAHWGVVDPAKLAFLDAPPQAALAEARVLLKEIGAIDAAGRITDEGRKLRSLPLPPRLARMVVDAAAEGSGALAATIAAVLTERGLGGDDVDLRHRIDNFRRDRSRRAEDARAMTKRWAETAGAGNGNGEHSAGALLALAYPDRIAKNRGAGGAFLLANGRGGSVDPASPLAREPFLAVAELTGAAAASRIVLAAPIDACRNRGALRRPDRGPQRGQLRRGFRIAARAATATAGCACADRADEACCARFRKRTAAGRGHRHARHWQAAVEQGATAIARSREIPAPCRRRASGPICPTRRWPANAAEWLAPFLTGQTALSQIGADDLTAALDALIPWNMRKRLDAEAPTHFTAPSGSHVPIDYEAEEGPKLVDPRAGIVRPCSASHDRRRARAAADRAVVAGAPAGAGDARSARLLARQLCRRQNRNARPLSPASLAGRSAEGARHPPRQAARRTKFNCSRCVNRPLTMASAAGCLAR